MLMKIKEALKSIKLLLPKYQYNYRIAEIDSFSQQVVIHIKSKNIFIRYSFSEAITHMNIIDEISPLEACWIGGYYGKSLRASFGKGQQALKKAEDMSFLLRKKRGLYKIMFQNRSGEIGYCNQNTGQEFVEHALTVANNLCLISNFDPSQACYIGILAGINMKRALDVDSKLNQNNNISNLTTSPSYLRVIK